MTTKRKAPALADSAFVSNSVICHFRVTDMRAEGTPSYLCRHVSRSYGTKRVPRVLAESLGFGTDALAF